ncbi:SER-THR-PHOSPHATASE domain-containing protein [Aphelenchoides fujianensis]|nr:SER-THR-PHOSPHATASE domain-containing protein [Aphelenchoides fujianensis]
MDTIVSAALSAEEQRVFLDGGRDHAERGVDRPAHPLTRPLAEESVKISHPLHPLHSLLIPLARNEPRQFALDYEELADVLERAAGVFAVECSLLEVPVPWIVYGDLHALYSDLHS